MILSYKSFKLPHTISLFTEMQEYIVKNIEHMNINVLDEGNLTLPTHNQPRNRREL